MDIKKIVENGHIHYELQINGRFVLSGDTVKEIMEEYKKVQGKN